MTSVNIPRDDFAAREAQNTKTPSVGALKQTTQTNPTQAIDPHQAAPKPRTAIRLRAKKDRRQGERRKHQVKVLLDTRSHRERRKSLRRASDINATQESENPNTQHRGIDVLT